MKEFIISIGNSAFVNAGDEACVTGTEILEAIREKSRFIWNALREDVTDKIEHIEYEEEGLYGFRFTDDCEKIIVMKRS